MVRLCLLVGVAAAAATSRARVDAAWGGLSAYFADPTAHFWKSCGQNGGNGAGVDPFNCACEAADSFCVNCYRWWMAVTVQSLVGLNQAVPGHPTRNASLDLAAFFYDRSPFTARASPSWAYIDDYLWYVLMWLDLHAWTGEARYLAEATATFELMADWGTDESCGGIVWLYPDDDYRKNAITALEAIQAAAKLAAAEAYTRPSRAAKHRAYAVRLWSWLLDVGLIGADGLVHDNVTGTADGAFHCCNATAGRAGPACVERGTATWTYNQGMLLGAAADLHALTRDAHYLRAGVGVLDAVVRSMVDVDGVLAEAVPLTVRGGRCDAHHDPSASAGGDLFAFKTVFFNQLPRFVHAARGVLPASLAAAAAALAARSADAAWATRALPPFAANDVCNEPRGAPAGRGGPPKFTWDWRAAPAEGAGYTCMDARTQAAAMAVFVADLVLSGEGQLDAPARHSM